MQGVGAAIQLLCTAAHAMGYGTCWMSAPVLAAPAIEGMLGVAPPARLVALVPVAGRSAPEPTAAAHRAACSASAETRRASC